MKNILNLILVAAFAFIMLIACEQEREGLVKPALPKPSTEPTYSASETQQIINTTYAWGNKNPQWDIDLFEAVKNVSISPTAKSPCKKIDIKSCLAQTISIMAKFESSFKPETSYKESFKDAKGNYVISRGLLQLSIESANQKAYSCGIKTADELHNPKININCAVKIAAYWINKDQVFFGGDKLGIGRYWSVGRKSSGSNAKILKYLSDF